MADVDLAEHHPEDMLATFGPAGTVGSGAGRQLSSLHGTRIARNPVLEALRTANRIPS